MTKRTTPDEQRIAVNLGREAERLARAMGLSPRRASMLANATPDTVRTMTRGHVPDCIKLHRLARVLNVTVDDMMIRAGIGSADAGAPHHEARKINVAPPCIADARDGVDLTGLPPAARLALMTLADVIRTA